MHKKQQALQALSRISCGCAPLGDVYGNMTQETANAIIFKTLEMGINFFDTSPYYGITKSEERLGVALTAAKKKFARSSYMLGTKVGRYGADEFDFSASLIVKSVHDSMQRLQTDYLDLVLCHDVEFAKPSHQIVLDETLPALRKLQQAGKIKYIGISGYPLPILLDIANKTKDNPLDVVLTYAHLTLHNSSLLDYAPKFRQAGVACIINASPLGMSLFTKQGPMPWHPASKELKQAIQQCERVASKHGMDIAELATLYSLQLADSIKSSTLIGFATVEQAVQAMDCIHEYEMAPEKTSATKQEAIVEILSILKPFHNTTW